MWELENRPNRTQARRAGSQTSAQPGRAGRRIAKIVERWRRGTIYIRGAAPPALGRCCGIDVPALPGWAEVWLPALRAWIRFAVHCRLSHTLSCFPNATQDWRPGLHSAVPAGLNVERVVLTQPLGPNFYRRAMTRWPFYRDEKSWGKPNRMTLIALEAFPRDRC